MLSLYRLLVLIRKRLDRIRCKFIGKELLIIEEKNYLSSLEQKMSSQRNERFGNFRFEYYEYSITT
jgi:hypothetical protein